MSECYWVAGLLHLGFQECSACRLHLAALLG